MKVRKRGDGVINIKGIVNVACLIPCYKRKIIFWEKVWNKFWNVNVDGVDFKLSNKWFYKIQRIITITSTCIWLREEGWGVFTLEEEKLILGGTVYETSFLEEVLGKYVTYLEDQLCNIILIVGGIKHWLIFVIWE